MSNDTKISSLKELYIRLKPALTTKAREMRRKGSVYIKETDIWNYLTENKWKNSRNLSLAEMVDDILNSDDAIIDDYLKSKISLRSRRIYFEEDNKE
jgi:hypothetical protein